jgi:hypothetical protein
MEFSLVQFSSMLQRGTRMDVPNAPEVYITSHSNRSQILTASVNIQCPAKKAESF